MMSTEHLGLSEDELIASGGISTAREIEQQPEMLQQTHALVAGLHAQIRHLRRRVDRRPARTRDPDRCRHLGLYRPVRGTAAGPAARRARGCGAFHRHRERTAPVPGSGPAAVAGFLRPLRQQSREPGRGGAGRIAGARRAPSGDRLQRRRRPGQGPGRPLDGAAVARRNPRYRFRHDVQLQLHDVRGRGGAAARRHHGWPHRGHRRRHRRRHPRRAAHVAHAGDGHATNVWSGWAAACCRAWRARPP